MMSPAAWALLVILISSIVLVLGLTLSQRNRQAICPHCRRPRVSGRTTCPYCLMPYESSRRTGRSPPSHVSPPEIEVPWLVALEGPKSGRRFPIMGTSFTIGRSADNQLRLTGRFVSRHHALITFQNGQYVLHDRNSTNGTYVNGRRVGEYILRSGDRIQIGPSVLEFRLPGVSARKSPTPVPSTPSTPSPPYSLLIPRFQDYVITPIKQGGVATIYKGVRRDGQQTVAIKVLHHTDPYIQQKFAEEAEILQMLNHPHIAKAYDHGQIDGRFYFVMEYCDGGTLRDRLVGGRPLPMDFVVSVIKQTCEALDYAHRHGVIHRDIKPENIMFTGRDYVKVVDFGIAKWAGRITRTVDGMVIGTPFYLSYEQARGLRVDQRSDIYSLGVVLYEMVTGRVPFQGQAMEVIRKHLTELPPPPRRFNPSLPPEIENAILRALQKDRRRRFQSALEFAAALGYRDKSSVTREGKKQPPSFQTSVETAPPLSLVITNGPLRGQKLLLTSALTVLGRQSVNPDDPQISRRHARIVVQGSVVWLEDLNSTNGTYHNGRRIFSQVLLKGGDEIRLGNTIVKVES